ncbi:MAG: hypothetical protein AAB462_00740 [Patescibacteria group bacterium]
MNAIKQKYHQRSKAGYKIPKVTKLFGMVLLMAFSLLSIGLSPSAQAAPSAEKPDAALKSIVLSQICPAVEKASKNKKKCPNDSYYNTQARVEATYSTYCNTNKYAFDKAAYDKYFKKPCRAYQGAKPIPNTPDPAACAADPTIPACAANSKALCNSNSCDLVKKYVNPAIQMLTIAFGLIAVISLVMGGIQYSASGGDPQKVTEAKKRISLTLMAIAAYAFSFAFIQFLVPGGVF